MYTFRSTEIYMKIVKTHSLHGNFLYCSKKITIPFKTFSQKNNNKNPKGGWEVFYLKRRKRGSSCDHRDCRTYITQDRYFGSSWRRQYMRSCPGGLSSGRPGYRRTRKGVGDRRGLGTRRTLSPTSGLELEVTLLVQVSFTS